MGCSWAMFILALSVAQGLVLQHSLVRRSSWSSRDNAPVVVLHGLLGSQRTMGAWSNHLHTALGSNCDVLLMNLRNHGDSLLVDTSTENSMTYERMAEDVRQTIAACGISRAHLVGHSMGGKVAAALALQDVAQRASLVTSLTLMDIMPLHYGAGSEFDTVRDTVSKLREVHDVAGSLNSMDAVHKHIECSFPETGMQQFVKSNARWRSGQLAWSFNLPAIARDIDAIADFPLVPAAGGQAVSYGGPALLLKATNSNFVDSSRWGEVEKIMPNCRLDTVPEAGHWLHIDQPVETAGRVAGFIEAAENAHQRRPVLVGQEDYVFASRRRIAKTS